MPNEEVDGGTPPLPDDICALARFVAAYYQEPIGLCFAQVLPPFVVARRAAVASVPASTGFAKHALNADQRTAVSAVLPEPLKFAPSLVQGVTGSGKTEVYLAAAARVIAAGRQALLLVPEINLTPQLVERIANALPGTATALLHSRLAPGERRYNWMAAPSGEAPLGVGP